MHRIANILVHTPSSGKYLRILSDPYQMWFVLPVCTDVLIRRFKTLSDFFIPVLELCSVYSKITERVIGEYYWPVSNDCKLGRPTCNQDINRGFSR